MGEINVTMERSRGWQAKDDFVDLVLSWSVEDILDENLYRNQVNKIPDTFQNVDEYLGSYIYPLLEETRAELASSMDTVYEAPFATVTSSTPLNSNEYTVMVESWKNRATKYGESPYKTLPGDVVLLSNFKPETANDLRRVGWTHAFGFVANIKDEENTDNCTSTTFNVQTRVNIVAQDDQQSKLLYVVFLMNVTTNKRMWSSLRMHTNLKIIEKVLHRNEYDEGSCESCILNFQRQFEVNVGSTLSSKLNESQHSAILASLHGTDCNHKASVKLIWGPPGTGKTTTLSVILYNLLRMKVRTLICAPTNVAITELALRVVNMFRDSFRDECENFLKCPLGDMLIFGSKERMKVGSEIEEIFLDYRVDSLVKCLAPLTGLKHCISSMIDFLEDCGNQYQIYVDNELIKAKENQQSEIQQSDLKSCLEFARYRFKHIVPSLRTSILTFFTHLPKSYILGKINQSAVQLMSLLDSMGASLFGDNLTPEALDTTFLYQDVTGSESLAKTSSLVYMRSQCLSMLRSLHSSISKLGLPLFTNKTTIPDFCFQNASLIFCTTSTSFKLHSVKMEPLNLVVIDEAAQLKEIESIIPLQIPDVKHAILVGDERQLPATVSSKVSEEAGFGKSLFERLSSLGYYKHLLNVQYRMHPSISQFPNEKFYSNQIIDAPNVRKNRYRMCYLNGKIFGPYSFINIPEGKDEVEDVGHSRRNMVEVAIIVNLVHKLYKAWSVSKDIVTVGVISPYAAQVAVIHDKLKQSYEFHSGFRLKVKSIDGFQGGEEDIIIMSTVRSGNNGSIGFLSNPQRVNVALTRARHCLWILGNEVTLSGSNSLWEALILDAKHRQCFFNSNEDFEITKTIITVKEELEQLHDLLNGESSLFKNARWKVIFSDNFRKSFKNLKPSHAKKWVINTLLRLASGWRPKKINVDRNFGTWDYFVKQFKVQGYHVICSIDIMKNSIWEQVLKVWDVLSLEEIPKLLERLDCIFSMLTDDFINRCKEKCVEGNLEVPKSWPRFDVVRYKNLNIKLSPSLGDSSTDCRSYSENSKVNESLLLMKFYSLSIGSVNHLLSDSEGREIELPFEVTDEEKEIILFPRSSFILGRSGTGKTTVLIMKLFQKLQQYCISSGDSTEERHKFLCNSDNVDGIQISNESKRTNLRQLFVTVSPKLCYAVKQHVSQLKSFASRNFSGNSLTNTYDIEDMTEFNDIPDTFLGIKPEKYPLIITFHKFLMMLNGTVGDSYFTKFLDVRESSPNEGRNLRSISLQTFMRKNEVTYTRFSSFYWPRFNTNLTKNLVPSKVFTEIMSHIKGGLQEGESYDGKRTKEIYLSLSDSRISTLSAEKREMIYDVYQAYEKIKMEQGEFDLADIVIDIHRRLKNENLLGDKMDFVYIDEVQDLNMRQIALFRYICKNVVEGFVFSGDTAQTISRGIDFRFEDIRSVFYNEFVVKSENFVSSGRREKGHISDVFRLSQNFRTHTGVLRLAHSVINLLCHFFPLSIDALVPETSFIYGEPPVVLEPGTHENSIITIFGCSGKASNKWVGFGAEQVILVRDNIAKKEVSEYIGNQALILTIVESKGLEFQDVLLYNFFGSSPLSNQWRVVYDYMNQKDLFVTNIPKSFPSFNDSRHDLLCSELKQLYVAITRTRQRLWICENNAEIFKPMLEYWQRLSFVQIRKLDDSLAELMQRASNPEEWKSQGIKLFWEKNYEMAIMCFERAGEATWEKRAKASGLREAADQLRASNPMEADMMLRNAAEIFDSIGRASSAAACFCDLEDYQRAGMIYFKKCGMSHLCKAGECFTLAGCYDIAAEAFAKGNLFAECLSACSKGKLFEMGLRYIEFWKQQAPCDIESMERNKEIEAIEQTFLESCARDYYKTKNKVAFMKFVRAFSTMEYKRSLLKELDCLEELWLLEEESGNFAEAAEIARLMGDVLLEVDLLEKAGDFTNSSRLILCHVLCNSLWVSGTQDWPLKSFPQKQELLSKSMVLAEKVSTSFHACICTESKVFSQDCRKLCDLFQGYIASKQFGSFSGEIISIKKILDVHFQTRGERYEWERESIDLTVCKDIKERVSRNQISITSLMYFWNLYKDNSLLIMDCLDSLERKELPKFKSSLEFCSNYFGVRFSSNSSVTCILLNPDAKWVEYVPKLHQDKRVVSIEARHFVSAARKYWYQDLFSIGIRVLEVLKLLQVVRSSSKYFQCICLTCIFDTAKFLTVSVPDDVKKVHSWKLHDFFQISTIYFYVVFPSDCQPSSLENMISVRESEISKRVLEEVISRTIGTKGDLTYGQIGKVTMIWLGSGKPMQDLYERMAKGFPRNSYWKLFIETLWGTMDSDFSVRSGSNNDARHLESRLPTNESSRDGTTQVCLCESQFGCYPGSLSHKFYKALEETFMANWRVRDFMSPNCFLYLLERLVILAPHSRGFLFASKSSFVEWILCQNSDSNPSEILAKDNEPSPVNINNFILLVIHQLLDINMHDDTKEWIRHSNLNPKYYFPSLILRLIVILCLVCLNSGMFLDQLFRLMALPYICSSLPIDFCKALRHRKNQNFSYLDAVAGALKAIGNPVVIVTFRENNLKLISPDAIFLDLSSFSCKKDIMDVLFSRKTESSHVVVAEENLTNTAFWHPGTGDNQVPSAPSESPEIITSDCRVASAPSGSQKIMSKTDSDSGVKNVRWQFLMDLFKELELQRNGNLKAISLRCKDDVKEHMRFLLAAVSQLSKWNSPSTTNEEALCEVNDMIENTTQLLTLLDISNLDDEKHSRMGELLKRLESRVPQVDNALSNILELQNTTTMGIVSGDVNDNNSTDGVDANEHHNDDSTNADVDANMPGNKATDSSQGKKKNKNKNKNNRKKGSKNRKK